MDILTRELFRTTGSKSYSASDLKSMGKMASNQYLSGGCGLADAIVKVAQENAGLTTEHVLRIVEYANSATFQSLFEKQASAHGTVDFDIAEPREVLHALDMRVRPEVASSNYDYSESPEKLASYDKSIAADVALFEMFGFSPKSDALVKAASKSSLKECVGDALKFVKTASVNSNLVRDDLKRALSVDVIKEASKKRDLPEADPHRDLFHAREELVKQAQNTKAATIANQQILREAMRKLSHEVKQQTLSGGNFGDVIAAMEYVDPSGQRVKEAMEIVAPEAFYSEVNYAKAHHDLISSEMQKKAGRTVNPNNPIVESFGAVVKAAAAQEKLGSQLSELNGLLKKANDQMTAVISGKPPLKKVASAEPESASEVVSDKEFHDIIRSLGLDAAIEEETEGLSGGLADGEPAEKYDPDQLEMGKKVEMEHTDDPQLATEIAKDHLEEISDYYTRLDEMEEEAKEDKEKEAFDLGKFKDLKTRVSEGFKGNLENAITRDVPAYAAVALTAAGLQALSGGISSAYSSVKGKMDAEKNFNRMIDKNPQLKEMDPVLVRDHFNTLQRFNPEYASDPLVAGGYVRTVANMAEFSLPTVGSLVQSHSHMTGKPSRSSALDWVSSHHTTPEDTEMGSMNLGLKITQQEAAAAQRDANEARVEAEEAKIETERARADAAREQARSAAAMADINEKKKSHNDIEHIKRNLLMNTKIDTENVNLANRIAAYVWDNDATPPVDVDTDLAAGVFNQVMANKVEAAGKRKHRP